MHAPKPKTCEVCSKKSMPTEEAARQHLGYLLRRRIRFDKPGGYAVRPYECPAGNGWHVGRDPATLMISFKKGRTLNVSKQIPLLHREGGELHSPGLRT